MSLVSTFAGSSFSPERMFRSTTAPVSKFLNLVRVNAAPLPGFTNWNSTTVNGLPSISTLRPLRISEVSYMARDVYPVANGCVKPVPDEEDRMSVSACRANCHTRYQRRGPGGALPQPRRARAGRVPRLG